MYELRPLQKGDFDYAKLRAYEKKFSNKFGLENLEAQFLRTSHPYTLLVDGETIGSAGFHIYWPGVCEVWMAANTSFEQHYFSALKLIRRMLDRMIEVEKIRRFQAPISVDLPVNQKFVEWLGFEKEGILRKFGPWGDDYIMYAKVID